MKKLDSGYCPAASAIEYLGNKWVLAVFVTLHENGVMRFGELYRTIPHVSEKMLADALRVLESDGLIDKRVYPEIPPRTEYRLTGLGDSLMPHLEGLMNWGRENAAAIERNRTRKKKIGTKR